MTEPDQPKRENRSRQPSPSDRSAPDSHDPNASGIFRWFDDLMDRILPKKDKAEPPE